MPRKVEKCQSNTLGRTLESSLAVTATGVTFPEFFRSRQIQDLEARVFHAPCRYDIIIGRDVLKDMGLVLNFKTKTMKWDDCIVPMRRFPRPKQAPAATKEPTLAEQLYLKALEADLEDDDTLPTCDLTDDEDDYLDDESCDSDIGNDQVIDGDAYASEINVSKYESADINKVVRGCTHLSQEQQNQLYEVLIKYPVLFNNELGTYPDERIHLDLQPDAVPHCQPRAYTVPYNHRPIFKAELDRLVNIGVLEKASHSEWIAGTFISPKKLKPTD